ncbi:MAG: DUF5318 family protein [Microthrixaceae bacterium]|nr:DUF5318 family protein [Microthrixaceae bacterium]
MEFLAPSGPGRPGRRPGSIDYRLTRRRVLRGFRAGDVPESDICDAQAELVRVAVSCSEPAGERCPVCDDETLRIVRFVFGPRLPKGGRAVSSPAELRRLAQRAGDHRCYEVEVCPRCRWNHLRETYPLVERSA